MRWKEITEDREPFIHNGSITFFSGGSRCRLTPEGDELYMSHVVTSEESRGQGHATKAVEKALAYADKLNKAVTLVAVPDNDDDAERLIAFYERFGFKQNTEDSQMMTRPSH